MDHRGTTLIVEYFDISTIISAIKDGRTARDAVKILNNISPYYIEDFEEVETSVLINEKNREEVEIASNAVREFIYFCKKCRRKLSEELDLGEMDWIIINRGWLVNEHPFEVINDLSVEELKAYLSVAKREKGYKELDFVKRDIGFAFNVAAALQIKETQIINRSILY